MFCCFANAAAESLDGDYVSIKQVLRIWTRDYLNFLGWLWIFVGTEQ
jgi:hypothetical protein